MVTELSVIEIPVTVIDAYNVSINTILCDVSKLSTISITMPISIDHVLTALDGSFLVTISGEYLAYV